jgi:aryl-alcohol dehydrogenase-like predicted oxidoreductase
MCILRNAGMGNLALAWVLTNPDVSTAIFGASSVDQVKDNLKALEVKELQRVHFFYI